MGIKQDVVIVNEFTVPLPGGKGSRGGTPGDYVTRYMARENATEVVAPIALRAVDTYVTRYMAREEAVESLHDEPAYRGARAIKQKMRKAQGQGGVAFGYGSVSLSHEELHSAAADIQRLFAEEGKTVMKTVLSFSDEYLKRHGIVPQDFQLQQRGDYRGNVDQMKLRMAVMKGLERMSAGNSGFDDLRYLAVAQVDTEHVHVHLAMVDAGPGRVTADDTQRGKLLDRHKARLRRGIDSFLDEKQHVAHLSSAVGYERRNVTAFVKRWAHEKIRDESLPQFLLATLPADRRLWRAGSNDRRMRKPNQIVRELVEEQLARPDSPMPQAMEKITAYANRRRENEGLSARAWGELIDYGREQVIIRGMNGTYQALKTLSPEKLAVRTPMLEVMGMDYEQLAAKNADSQERGSADELLSFGFRLRSYGTRLNHHREQASTFRQQRRVWEQRERAGAASEDSRLMFDFFQYEQQYHAQLMAKYQHFLPFGRDLPLWQEQLRQLQSYEMSMRSLQALRDDRSLQDMRIPAQAEMLGRELYGQTGGALLASGPDGRRELDRRLRVMQERYAQRREELVDDLAGAGLVLRSGESPEDPEHIEEGAFYDFDGVKALDLHHLGFDFTQDVRVGKRSSGIFVVEARKRLERLEGAMDYLDATGQSEAIETLPVQDVAEMMRVARDIERQREAGGIVLLRSRIAELRRAQAAKPETVLSATTRLDEDLSLRVRDEIDTVTLTMSTDAIEWTYEPDEREMS